MTLRAVELAAVCEELERELVGRPVHKVVQPDAHSVVIELRGRALLIGVGPRVGRVHLLPERPAGTGEAASAFCMLLRKHLVGARLASVQAIEGERACVFGFAAADDEPALRVFLFGPSAQLQLLARDDHGERRVLGAIGPARRLYDALPAPHPGAAAAQVDRFVGPSPSVLIAAHYATLEHDTGAHDARRRARAKLNAERARVVRLRAALGDDLARADGAEALRRCGDLLLAHLHEVPRGASRVELPDDFSDGRPVEITLDPARSARDNAERIYKEARRLGRARGAIGKRIAEAETRLAALDTAEATLDAATDERVLADDRVLVPTSSRGQAPSPSLPYKRFLSVHGVPIYVGRGAKKNDELTWKVARGNDLWMHTRDVPGAHVVVPLAAGRSVDPETLVDAATLAAHHSSARGEAQVDVAYALRKHLRKPRGAPPGAVLVSHEKTMRVRMEAERLERLLKSAA